jgi:outer membrane protein OmpA-like peptidoglycan-associated protein
MNARRQSLQWAICLPITFALVTSGCATKKYARQQAGAVNQRLSQFEAKTNEQIAYLNKKQASDMAQVQSQLNEEITATNNSVAQNAATAQQAAASADKAMEAAQANQAAVEAHAAELSKLASAMSVTPIEKGDVTFGFNKSVLDDDAKVALDLIIQKARSTPGTIVELVGFTDRVGSAQYNLALSRRRAEAVERYLVLNNIPARSIHIVGMGKEAPPPSLVADFQAIDPNASRANMQRLARRVYIRVFATGVPDGEAAREATPPNQ